MAQADIAQTVSKMKKIKTATLGWDVVVSYGETEINKLLASDFIARDAKQIQEISGQVIGTNEEGDDYSIDFKFELSAPLISFSATRTTAVCNLAMSIVGGYGKTKAKNLPIKSGVYTMHFNTLELASASGDNNNYTPPDKSFVFNLSTKSDDGFVVIDLANSESLTIDITESEGLPADDYNRFVKAHKASLFVELKKNLLANFLHVRYELARVKSERPLAEGMIELVPRSFRFAAYEPGGSAETVLSLFIQTRDSKKGEKQNLDLAWKSQWRKEVQCSPIPTGQTASVIFNKDMIFDCVIRPALNKQGFSGELRDTNGDITLDDIDTKKVVHRARSRDSGPMEDGFGTIDTISEINVTPPSLLLKFYSEDGSTIYCSRTWKYEYEFEWSRTLFGSAVADFRTGRVKAIHELRYGNVTSFKSLLDDYSVKMECSVDEGMWGVDFSSRQPSIVDRMGGGVGVVPGWVRKLSVELPDFTIDLGSFNFFLTTNLLLPSRTQTVVIVVDKEVGLKIPGDLYIVGKVASS